MLTLERTESDLHIHYRHYLLPVALLILPPLLLIEHGPGLVDGSIDASNLAGLALGVLLPLGFAWFYIEFGRFTFSRRDGVFALREARSLAFTYAISYVLTCRP